MVFKLVRVGNGTGRKINLPIGRRLIGRMNFLHDDNFDKRISRSHAELQVTADSVTIKSLHQNPCFYIKSSSDGKEQNTQILNQNCELTLSNGDKFGLLPDNYWYQLIEVLGDSEDDKPNTENIVEKDVSGDDSQGTELLTDCQEQNNASEEPNVRIKTESKDTTLNAEPQSNRDNSTDKVEPPAHTNGLTSPTKRSCSIEDVSSADVKKVKIEPGPSNTGPSNSGTNDPNVPDTTNKPAQPTLRERCMYGANCYRRNPQHKVQFSHPSDEDWGAGAQAPCPWGRACRRSDPRHWRDHEHPPGHQPPPAPGQKQKRKKQQKTYDSEEDEDELTTNLVTGKRQRKTLNRQTYSGSEDESERDPFGTDESDEWEPPGDFTQSQEYTEE